MSTFRTFLAVAWTLACGAHAQDASHGQAPTQASQTDATQISVLQPGQDPQPVRYRFEQGATAHLRIVLEVESHVDMGFDQAGGPHPTLEYILAIEPVAVSEDGADIRATIAYAGVRDRKGVEPALRNAMGEQLAAFRGAALAFAMSTTGQITDARMEGWGSSPQQLPGLEVQLAEALQAAFPMLPADPIGAGGAWTVVQPRGAKGIAMQSDTHHRLVSTLDDGRLQIESAIEFSAEPQELDIDGMPPGARASLDSVSGAGAGQTFVALGSLAAEATMTQSTTISIKILDGGQQMDMGQMMLVKTIVQPIDEDQIPRASAATARVR
ncbi:MAG: hypothetical protein AAFX79_12645 [Planctomycetota bacterium]